MSASFGELLREARVSAGLTQEELAERAEVSDRGIRYLERDLRRPHRETAQRLAEALGLESQDEARFLTAARPRRPPACATGWEVPILPYPLVGRERDGREVSRLLTEGGVRLLTLTGPGGVGKTSLALDVAAGLREGYGDGIAWVSLASLTDPRLAPSAIAKAVGLLETGGAPLQALRAALVGRPTLLAVDNLEHLAGAVWFIGELIASCPQLTVLATSRAPLRLRAEHEFPVSPLPVPAGVESLPVYAIAANPAVELFLRRAQAVKPTFALTPADAGAVAAICRQLDGLPLALELAAARVRVLPPRLMLERLADRLSFLTGGPSDLPARQRTMRGTVAWSYELLTPGEQAVFAQLAVFDGGFGAGAIESVLGPDDPGPLLDAIESLQRNNLLLPTEAVDDEPRFRMLGTVRDFALEHLGVRADAREIRSRHAKYYLEFAETAAGGPYGLQTARWLDLLEQDQDNLRAAARCFLDHRDAALGLRLCAALWWYWYVRGYATEGRAELARFLTLPESAQISRPRAAALLGSGQLAQTQGDYPTSRMFLTESIRVCRELGDERDLAAALLAAGFTARVQEDYESARILLDEALAKARASANSFIVAAALHHLGMIAADADRDLVTARRLLTDSLDLYRDLGFPRFIALLRLSLGEVACAGQDYPSAYRLLTEGLAGMRDAGERLGMHGALDALARLAASTSDPSRAVMLAAAAQRLRSTTGSRSWPVVERHRSRWLGQVRGAWTEEEFSEAWVRGESMTLEQAISYALESPGFLTSSGA